MRRVLLGVTGGIAAYKAPLLVRLLRKGGCEVRVVMTGSAKPLVGAEALRTLSGGPVYLDGEPPRFDMDHIRLAEWADLFLVCPATANTIARMACGIAGNLLTTLALSIPEGRIMVAPAMNSVMWANGATRANVGTLASRGVTVLPVEEGELACGVSGPGRMLAVEEIARRVFKFFDDWAPSDNPTAPKPLPGEPPPREPWGDNSIYNGSPAGLSLEGKTVLISSGPTEEPIDPVRVITNRSSGKMGAALARAALLAGARVIVVSGPASEPLPRGAEVVPVRTAAEMERELTARFAGADICVMAAAVSDYRPANPSGVKLRRSEGENVTLELAPNPDIAAKLGASKSGRYLAGFALESGGDVGRAAEKMARKNCDMMVFNRADVSLGGDSTGFVLLFGDGRREAFPVMGKAEAARIIIDKIAKSVNGIDTNNGSGNG